MSVPLTRGHGEARGKASLGTLRGHQQQLPPNTSHRTPAPTYASLNSDCRLNANHHITRTQDLDAILKLQELPTTQSPANPPSQAIAG